MGLLNGSITFKAFKVTEGLPRNFKELLAQNLPKFTFREINPKINPEMSIGWVNAYNPLDTHLEVEKILFGKYLILGIRKDRKSIPSAMLKARLNEAIRAAAKERHGRRFSREEITSLKETLKEKLLADVTPNSTLFEMVWNYDTQDVYVSTQAQKATDEFVELFESTFNKLPLLETTLPVRLESYIEARGLGLELDSIDPAHFGVSS